MDVLDTDNDGDLDIITTWSDWISSSIVNIYENTSSLDYTLHSNTYYDIRTFDGIIFKDFNLDGYPDILNYTYVSKFNINDFGYPFSDIYMLPVMLPDYPIYYDYSCFDYIDLDGNHTLDFILLYDTPAAMVRVYYNRGDGSFSDDPIVTNNDEHVAEPQVMISAYPNPFTNQITFTAFNKKPAIVSLTIYNIKGQKIKEIIKNSRNSREMGIIWDGTNDHNSSVASSVYFARMSYSGKNVSKKLVLVK